MSDIKQPPEDLAILGQLNLDYNDADQASDAKRFSELLAEDFVVQTPDVIRNREEYLEYIAKPGPSKISHCASPKATWPGVCELGRPGLVKPQTAVPGRDLDQPRAATSRAWSAHVGGSVRTNRVDIAASTPEARMTTPETPKSVGRVVDETRIAPRPDPRASAI